MDIVVGLDDHRRGRHGIDIFVNGPEDWCLLGSLGRCGGLVYQGWMRSRPGVVDCAGAEAARMW